MIDKDTLLTITARMTHPEVSICFMLLKRSGNFITKKYYITFFEIVMFLFLAGIRVVGACSSSFLFRLVLNLDFFLLRKWLPQSKHGQPYYLTHNLGWRKEMDFFYAQRYFV